MSHLRRTTTLEHFKLSNRAMGVLKRNNVTTAHQLVAIPLHRLLVLKGLGRTLKKEITAKVLAYCLTIEEREDMENYGWEMITKERPRYSYSRYSPLPNNSSMGPAHLAGG